MNLESIRHARKAVRLAAVAAALTSPVAVVGSAAAAGCVPGLLLEGPSYAESNGEPAEIVVTDTCSGDAASDARLHAVGKHGSIPVGDDGRALVQFAGPGSYRLWAGEDHVRSNTLVIKVR